MAQPEPHAEWRRPYIGPVVVSGGRLEIRLLGPFQVRRQNGSTVDPTAWRTGKTADLVRLLALRDDEPVPTQSLIAQLWPRADRTRALASLRTAACQVRHVLGSEHLERSPMGLRLRNVWIDVVAFRALAVEARQRAGSGAQSSVISLAREADSLYRGILRAHDDDADWVQTERKALADTYQVLLCDAAEEAVCRTLARDAVDFAGRALALDPFSERACRLVMRGYAEMGETSLALREFERCRKLLNDERSVAPSPQTRELHLFLLRTVRPA